MASKEKENPENLKLIRHMAEFQRYEINLQDACQRDFENLLLKFAEKQSLCFSDFSILWKLENYNLIFAGQKNVDDVGKFTEICIYLALKLFMHPKNLYTEVGAFYLLYALYYTQPFKEFIKIRLTHDEYKKLMNVVNDMKTRKQYDFLYIYGKLYVDNAFVFVATTTPIGISYNYLNLLKTSNDTFQTEKDDLCVQVHSTLANILDDIRKTDKEYHTAMKRFSEAYPELGITVFNSTTSEDLQKLIQALKPAENSTSCEEMNIKEETVSSRRKIIKNKAVSLKNETHRETITKKLQETLSKPKNIEEM